MISFTINKLGKLRSRYVNVEAKKIFLITPVFSLFIIFMLYLSLHEKLLLFYIASGYFLILMLLLALYAPLKLLFRHNASIEQICFNDDYIFIKSFKALWMKPKEYRIPRKRIKVKESKFSWLGKGDSSVKEGLSFMPEKSKELYLIYLYFDESDKIKEEIYKERNSL